ncbi:MAG TPA: hypothetical protein VL120_12330 [Solirubrobacteraceae bacterium]|jgi:hypothetical protein|nr:hypothetical protein [Solirubrobacteraceae bacterium]
MTPRPLVLSLAVAGVLGLAPVASAATLTTDTRCYQERGEVVLRGEGYAPNSTVTVMRDGAALGAAPTEADGTFQRKFTTPALTGVREAVYSLTATDQQQNAATTRYRSTKVFADFNPGSGNPRRLRVRFTVNGFGLARAHASVYLHYVRKGSSHVTRTIRLGTARGTCGVIRQTKLRRLFPFAPSRGTWILQFDTFRRYERATSKRTTPWVRKPVEVFTRKR